MPSFRAGIPIRVVVGLAMVCALALFARQLFPARPVPPSATLTLAAASDLKYAMEDMVVGFKEARPDVSVTVTHGASGSLFTQLNHQAPFDLYFSADLSYPQRLAQAGWVLEGSQFLYAEGHLVVWVPNRSPLDLQRLGIQALLEPSVQKIALANPRHAPYGRAAEAALESLGISDAVKHKLVFGENVSQAAQFVQTGAADIGIIALSLASAPMLKSEGRYWSVPGSAHPKLEQAGVILKWTKFPEAAESFKRFVMGPEGRAILERHGFSSSWPSP